MANGEAQSGTAGTAVYVPWRTFLNTLEALSRHMPNRIDKSAFPGQSGAVQNQLVLAFRFLGLIDDEGKPTSSMLAVTASDEGARKAALRQLIEAKYGELFAINLMKATPAEFAEQITKSYNVSGDTRLKATRFFLAAAAYLGIEVSPLLSRDKTKASGATVSRGAPKKRRGRRSIDENDDINGNDEELDEQPPQAGESRTVTLKSGGTLTLSASTKFMALSSADRNFVFGLIDKLEEYEQQNGG